LKRRFLLFSVLFVAMVVIDQLVKVWARQTFGDANGFPTNLAKLHGAPWPGVFELTLVYNKGVAFGLFQGLGVFLAPVAIAIAVGAGIYSWKHQEEPGWTHAAMGLLAAGAIGNLVDRAIHHKVTDMFWFRLINFPVFNVADACITVATALLLVVWTLEAATHKKTHPAAGTAETTPAETEYPA
jgi:signal peptidase II